MNNVSGSNSSAEHTFNRGDNRVPYVSQPEYTPGTWGLTARSSAAGNQGPGGDYYQRNLDNPGYRGHTADYYERHLVNPGFRGEPHGFPHQADWGGYDYPGYGTNPGGYWGAFTPPSPNWSANAQNAYQGIGFPNQSRISPGQFGAGPNGVAQPTRTGHARSGQGHPASGQNYRGVGPRNYQRSDERILEDVQDRFLEDPHLNPSDVDVTIHDGVVTLTGTVSDRAQKRRAEDLADAVSGVKDVDNRLTIRKPGSEPG